MSTYTDASLIVTPNAKKAGKLYALKGADLDAVRATTATYVGSDGLIKTAGIDEVRFDYTNGSCPSILVEPQRTNLLLRSEELNVSPWINSGVSVTANNTTSPNNTLTADRITNTVNADFISQIVNGTLGITYTFTIYIKNDNSTQTRVFVRNTIDSLSGLINWSGSILTSISSVTGGTLNFMELSNGWYRLTGVFTSVESLIRPRILPDTTAGSRSVFLWGAQLEAGANATSYIPTVASTVTRNADVISKTGISDLIGQSQGVIFTDFNITNNDLSSNKTIISLDDNSYYVNIIAARILNTNRLDIIFRAGSVDITFSNMPIISNGNHKIAIRYGNGFASIFVDGMLINTQVWTSSFTNTISQLFVGKNRLETPYFNDAINSLALWKTALTDQQCISMTQL